MLYNNSVQFRVDTALGACSHAFFLRHFTVGGCQLSKDTLKSNQSAAAQHDRSIDSIFVFTQVVQ